MSNQEQILVQTSHAKRLLAATGVLSVLTFIPAFVLAQNLSGTLSKPSAALAEIALAGTATIIVRSKASNVINAIKQDPENDLQAFKIKKIQRQEAWPQPAVVAFTAPLGGWMLSSVDNDYGLQKTHPHAVLVEAAVGALAIAAVNVGDTYRILGEIEKLSAENNRTDDNSPKVAVISP